MTTWRLDTHAGPVVEVETATETEMRSLTESWEPMLQRRGYAHRWERQGPWNVLRVIDTKGRIARSCAFRAV